MQDPDAGHPTKPPKSGCRRAAGCLGSVFLLILALLFVPPQISRVLAGDLRPAPLPVIAQEDNALEAVRRVVPNLKGGTPGDPWEGTAAGQVADPARAWIESNRGLLPDFDRALALPEAVLPWEDSTLTGNVQALTGIREALRFGGLAAAVDAEDGDTRKAVERLSGLLRLSRGVSASEASLIGSLVGLACEAITLRFVQLIADARPVLPDAEAWSPLREMLAAGPTPGEIAAGALRGEYRTFYFTTLEPESLPAGTMPSLATHYKKQRLIPANSFYDRYRTVARYKARHEVVITEAAKPRPDRDEALLEAVEYYPGGFPGYNPIGEALLKVTVVLGRSLLNKTDELVAQRRMTVLHLACRLYYDEHDKLPETLDGLVAAGVLDAVPLDPFDEQPLRYDPERKLLWSIGANEQDDGGVERSTSRPAKPLDIVVPLEFGAM